MKPNSASVKRTLELIELAESLKRDRDRNQGRLDGILHTLEEDFDCSSMKEAKKTLIQLKEEIREREEELERETTEFDSTYGEKLESL